MEQLFWQRAVSIVFVFFALRFPRAVATKPAVPALFSFGDSILDTGNNNNLQTMSKCNFPPYGRDFPGGVPTGRFCNGRNPTDLIASALGVKETVPAYLSTTLTPQDLITGVSFASGGSGLDDLTSKVQGVITTPAQLAMFKEYIGKLTAVVGQQRASEILANSIFLVSAGNNDVAFTYSFLLATTRPFPQYVSYLISLATNFYKSLYDLGVRKVWVLSTLPLGCLPGGRTTGGGPLRFCAELANMEAQTFNGQLSEAVDSLKASLPNYDIRFVDVYNPFLSIINNPQASGFTDAGEACCGTAPFGVSGLCNLLDICPNPSTFIFWDFAHPTERAYQLVVNSILQKMNMNVPSSFASSHVNTSITN
ncbi:GDSL esterase/lipase At1g23500-like [Vigna umbellata]|uniref:GDSL esterase/lipase At1g23500-like n=1 Tax=Vigna umbellata TaxID=87088 RepID=UPI001F5E8DBC|nr:GDSL esterase/lipase At1g23500-like [Vigna umbellata]